jgi:putative hydrolase of the HAD superfamily
MGQKLLNIKAIGFDVDQTLYLTPPGIDMWIMEELVSSVAKYLGKSPDEVKPLYEERLAELSSNTETLYSFGLDGQQVFKRLFDELPLEKYLTEDERLTLMLTRLAQKYRLFVISNGTERQVKRKLEILGVDPEIFSPLICCYDHPGWNKPSPAPFLAALEELELAPEEVVFVGDHIEKDVGAAEAVGMKGILVGKDSETCPSVYDIEQLFA